MVSGLAWVKLWHELPQQHQVQHAGPSITYPDLGFYNCLIHRTRCPPGCRGA